MLKYCLVLYLITSVACAQTLVKGRVFENGTRITLTNIQVVDINNKEVTVTDDNGRYSISAKPGDMLVFTGFSYQADTVLITDKHEREAFLAQKEHLLGEINVNTTAAPSTFKWYDPEFHGQTVVYQRDKDGNFKGGVIFRLWYWKKDEKKKARDEKIIAGARIRDQISTVFTAATIAKYIPLRGTEIDDFVLLYMPDEKTYTAGNFNLVNYINAGYKKFMKLPADKRHLTVVCLQ